MFETVATFKSEDALLKSYSRLSPALTPRLGVLILLLAVALTTTSCSTLAQAAGAQTTATPNNLNLYGNFPAGTVSESYNAVLAVGGGKFPYHFSVKTGALPPGISLNPTTGSFSGKPTSAGTFSFEVIVTDAPNLDQGNKTFVIAVGSGSGGSTVKVSVSPTSATLFSNQKQQLTAAVSGTSNTGVKWSATAGSVDASGLYTAPTVTSQTNVVVKASSVADWSKSASAALTVGPVNNQSLKITTGNLPQGQHGNAYSEVLSATGGTTPYSWSISAGAPPPGIAMNANGDFAGIPTAVGTFSLTVKVSDANAKTATGNFSVTVLGGSNFDGPAELPRVTVPSAMSDTPAPGAVVNVNAGGDLQSALNNAHCGDVIQLQAGATFSGEFDVPVKNCDINHWIIIRTSAPDSALPAEGQRATPCYAGVASLVGRPQYSCLNPKNVMAKVQMPTQGDGPFQIDSGANYYRFIGLEITRPSGTPGSARLVSIATKGGTADHLVFDRLWMHGAAQDETRNAVALSGMTNIAVVDSYLNDFHCIASTGTCTDAHAISGGNSNTQDGPYKIQDNFLEASGESILFGGGPATFTPADIQVLNNHFWKPWQWMPGSPNFVGGKDGHPFIVKNHFELKNAVRVLVEANIMENSWGGFTQTGYGILLTPRNQATQGGLGPFVCPLCQVTDVTIRYVRISHAGGGIQMATVQDTPNGPGQPALAGTRWSIHDVVIDDLSKKYVGGGSVFEMINGWAKNALNTVTINHVTGFPDPAAHIMILGNRAGNMPMYGLVFTNNMLTAGRYPVWNAIGGTGSCAQSDVPVIVITNCFTTFTFTNNALVATPAAFPPSTWPLNNMFPQTVDDARFVNFSNGVGGNYELQPSSLYKNKSTDGKDLGADIVGLNAALANVE